MISNLPSWVFSNSDTRKLISRILCFRLQESSNATIENLADYIQCLVSTLIGGGTEIQLNLQSNVYTVHIPTGDYKATDFDKIDASAKKWLRESGYDSVNNFILNERMTVRDKPGSMVYSGFDEKLLLLVQYLRSATVDVLIVSSNSYWLYFLFPTLVFTLQRGVVVNVLVKPSDQDTYPQDEMHRQRQLVSMGVGVRVEKSLPFDGFVFDRNNDDATAVISTAEGFLERDYTYGDERIRVYTRAYDAPIIHALNVQLNYLELDRAEPVNLNLIKIDPEIIFRKLQEVRQYRASNFKLEDIDLGQNIYVLDRHIKEFRLTQAALLIEAFKRAKFDLFVPAAFKLGSQTSSIVTPPILERIGDKLVIIEGSTRFYYALKNNLMSIQAIVVEGTTAELPAEPRPISSLNLASDTLNAQELYESLNSSELRL